MKKLLAFFMALIMLISMTLCVNATETDTAPEVPAFGHSLDNIGNAVTPPSGSPVFANASTSGATNLAGASGSAYKLTTAVGENVSTASSILPIYPRNTKGTDDAVGTISSSTVSDLVRGTYTVSIWLRSNDVEEFASANTKLAVELFPSTVLQKDFKDAVDDGSPIKPGDVGVGLVTLFSSDNDQYSATFKNTNDKTWYKYSAEISVNAGFSQMCIWAIVDGEETKAVNVWIDELSIEKVSKHETPVLAGAQISDEYDYGAGKAVSVRFLGGVDNYENYEALGFRIAYRYDGSGNSKFTYKDITTDSVYTSVLVESSGKHTAVKSTSYGMKYFYATSVDGIEIKSSGQYEFIITPVAIEKDTHRVLVLESCRYVITANTGKFDVSGLGRVDMDTLPTDYASVNSLMK